MTPKQLKQKAKELGEQPAFPCECVVKFTDGSKVNERPFDSGLTKREYFAGLAMNGLQSSPGICNQTMASLSKLAVKQTDALLEELAKEGQQVTSGSSG